MFYTLNTATDSNLTGAKSANLVFAKQAGVNVFDVLTITDIAKALENIDNTINIIKENLKLSSDDQIILRSSANCEDSPSHSFAGIFESKVVNFDKLDLTQELSEISNQSKNTKLKNYCDANSLDSKQVKVYILVQKFSYFDYSGVVFSTNPTAPENGVLVNIQKGQPNQVVNGEHAQVIEIPYHKLIDYSDLVSKSQQITLIKATNRLRQLFKKNIDIEFGFIGSKLWILQVRPITHKNLNRKLYLDSSNLQENFPEPILPLTYSILQKMYFETYFELIKNSGYSHSELYKHSELFQNLLCNIDGNVYYNIGNWYKMGNLLPRNKQNNSGLQGMIGGKVDTAVFSSPNKINYFKKIKYLTGTLYKFATFSKTISKYQIHIQNIINSYLFIDYSAFNVSELVAIWYKLSGEIDLNTYINAENDFLLMYFSQKFEIKYGQKEFTILLQNISNHYKFSTLMQAEFMDLVKTHDTCERSKFLDKYMKYEVKYKGRFINDLNLKKTQPAIMDQIQKFAESNFKQQNLSKLQETKKAKFLENQVRKYLINREQNRLYRSQIFDIIRKLFESLEVQFLGSGILLEAGDIHYLTFTEITDFINLNSPNPNLSGLVEFRKKSYNLESERDYRAAFGSIDDFNSKKQTILDNLSQDSNSQIFYGTPCSAGSVKDKVVIYDKKINIQNYKGILVVKNLDPGWTISLATVTGLVIEEGGVLSHGAIVAREMGIPAIIGVSNITKILKSGDEITINGSEGNLIINTYAK